MFVGHHFTKFHVNMSYCSITNSINTILKIVSGDDYGDDDNDVYDDDDVYTDDDNDGSM